MKYLLDTSTCIYLINRHPNLKAEAGPEECGISVISLGELECAAASFDYVDLISYFTKRINVMPMDHDTASIYAEMRLFLEADGRALTTNTLWSAAHASTLGLTFVTTNTHHFRDIPELTVATWLDDP